MVKNFFIMASLALIFFITETALTQEKGIQSEEIIQIIQEKSQAVKSYKASFDLKMQGPQGETVLSGIILFKRPDKIRMEMSLPEVQQARQVMVSDGVTLWQFSPFLKVASKVDIGQLKEEFGEAYFTQPQENTLEPFKAIDRTSIQYLGKERFNAQECFVLEARPKAAKEGEGLFFKAKIWIDTETGLEKKTVFFDLQGKEVFSRNFKKVEVNLDIPDLNFEFKLPEGIEVMDVTEETRKMIEESLRAKEQD